MTDREIMQQALSAFEAILFEKNIEATQIIARNARYSLREALAQPEQESKPMYVMGNYAGEGKVVSASFGLPKGAFEFAPHTGKGEASKIKHSLEPQPAAKHVCNLWINPETSEYEVDRCTHPINEVIPVYTALAQPEQEEPLPLVDIGVDVTPEGTHVVACYNRPDAVQEMFYSQFHPLTKPEQEPKLSDAGADTNISRGLEPKGSGMVTLNQPVAWMLPDYGDVLSASEADGTGIYNIPLYTAPPKREQELVCDKDPHLCGFVQCQLGKVCKNTIVGQFVGGIPEVSQQRDWVCKNCGEQNVD